MNFRLMSIDNYEAVYHLWSRTPGMGLNPADASRDGILKYLSRNPSTCFIAENNNEVIGVIMSGHDGRRGFIYHLAVKASERNKGIGGTLVRYAIESLRKEGIHKVSLVVFSNNELGNAFWDNKGFSSRNDLIYRNKSID